MKVLTSHTKWRFDAAIQNNEPFWRWKKTIKSSAMKREWFPPASTKFCPQGIEPCPLRNRAWIHQEQQCAFEYKANVSLCVFKNNTMSTKFFKIQLPKGSLFWPFFVHNWQFSTEQTYFWTTVKETFAKSENNVRQIHCACSTLLINEQLPFDWFRMTKPNPHQNQKLVSFKRANPHQILLTQSKSQFLLLCRLENISRLWLRCVLAWRAKQMRR